MANTPGRPAKASGRLALAPAPARCRPMPPRGPASFLTRRRSFYSRHQLPGRARRASIDAAFVIPPAPPIPPPANLTHIGTDPAQLKGLVLDESKAIVEGSWKASTFELDFVGTHYIHDDKSGKGTKSVRWEFQVPESGRYEVRLSYTDSSSRDKEIPVTIEGAGDPLIVRMNQQLPPPHPGGFAALGVYRFTAGEESAVTISNKGTTGHVIADAVQLVRQDG